MMKFLLGRARRSEQQTETPDRTVEPLAEGEQPPEASAPIRRAGAAPGRPTPADGLRLTTITQCGGDHARDRTRPVDRGASQ
jgi:hypothetical protein